MKEKFLSLFTLLYVLLPISANIYAQNASSENIQSIPRVDGTFDWKKIDISTPTFRITGSFTAFFKNQLIVAGGYDQNEQSFTDAIHVYNHLSNQWETLDIKLHEKAGYGSTSVADGRVYFLGGMSTEGVSKKVSYLEYDELTNSWKTESIADLPKAVALTGSCVFNNNIYLAGGISHPDSTPLSDFYRYSSNSNSWEKLQSLPENPGQSPSLVVQNNGEKDLLYLFSTAERDRSVLMSYDFSSGNWKKGTSPPVSLSRPAGVAKNSFNLFFLPRQKINIFDKESSTEPVSNLGLIYHTITNNWMVVENPDITSATTLFADESGLTLLQNSGGNLSFHMVNSPDEGYSLRFLDLLSFIIYIALLLYIGYWFSQRSNDTEDYFRGGKRVPAWAAGISIIATKLSAVTFMSIPAKVFATDWLYILIPLNGLFLAYFVVKVVLPFFHRLNITSAYEYLERRFNVVVRFLGSLSYLLWEISRIGILLLLPAIVISVVLQIDIYLCIALIGIVATLYTLLGGIEAVVWTDVLQVLIMFGGIVLALIIMIYKTDGTIPELIQTAASQHKLRVFDFNFDFTTATVWVIMIGWIGRIQEYVSTQSIVQRFVTVKDEREAGKSMWISAIVVLPIIVFFYLAGTGLFLFYQEFPQALDPNLEQLDAILPYFVITQLPAGIAGLVIAAIFAAAMSSLDSGIHSMSTVITTDWYRRFSSNYTEKQSLKLAKYLVVILGIFGTVSAMLMAGLPIQSLFDQLMLIMGLFGGGLAGMFLLGMLSKRANTTGVLIGFFVSAFVQYAVSFHTNIHFLLYSVTGLASCFVIGYIASMFSPTKGSNNQEYTVYGLLKN